MLSEDRGLEIIIPDDPSNLSKKSMLKTVFQGDFLKPKDEDIRAIENKFWEYVIILKNPDFPSLKNSKITRKKAEEIYRKALKKKKLKNPLKEI